jgi:hypothetical protein
MKYFWNRFVIDALLLSILLFNCQIRQSSAQTAEPENKWNFLTEIYLLFPNMNGTTGLGDLISVPIDAGPGDIFSNLKFGGMLYLEAQTNNWAVTSDLVFMNLGNEITETTLLHSGTVKANQGIWEAAGLYRIFSFAEVGIGGRLNHLKTSMDVRRNVFPAGTEEVVRESTATWFDPVIVTRLTADINDKWLFQFRGDIGGFSIGSKLTWQLQAYTGYRFSKVFQLTAGYRILSTDYTKNTDNSQFIFDIDEFGPVIRFGFNF